MDRVLRPVAVSIAFVFVVIFLAFPLLWAARVGGAAFHVWEVWRIYSGYVNAASNLTGLNQYLVTALAILFFLPFYLGVHMVLASFALRPKWLGGEGLTTEQKRRKRYLGAAMLVVLAVGYNVGLYYLTKEMAFAFSTGAPQKWYALTPAGVRFFDRPGVDPEYGVPLKPVTPQNIHRLRLAQKGEFKPADASRLTFFNPITGEAQVWYYRYPDGTVEFYDKPGYHPITGAALQPVTEQVVLEWRKLQKSGPTGIGSDAGSGGRKSSDSQAGFGPLQIRSDPEGADAYLDWKPKGQTPTAVEQKEASGLIVVFKEGHRAAFQRVDRSIRDQIAFTLQPEVIRPRKRLLLVAAPGGADEAALSLRSRLIEEGFTVLGLEEGREFQRELDRAGGMSNRALRAWAREKFDTDLVLIATVRQSSRKLSEQELGYLGIRETVKGAVRAEVEVDVEVVDLRSGDGVAAVSTKGSGFGLDSGQGFQKAITQATTESAKALRKRIQG